MGNSAPHSHGGHAGHDQRAGHDKHAGHSVAMFRDKFWISLLLTIPTLVWGHMLQRAFTFSPPLAVDGEPATPPAVLNAIIGRHRVGDVVRLALQKGVVPSTVSVALKGMPSYKLETYESAGLPVSDAVRAFRARWLSSLAR